MILPWRCHEFVKTKGRVLEAIEIVCLLRDFYGFVLLSFVAVDPIRLSAKRKLWCLLPGFSEIYRPKFTQVICVTSEHRVVMNISAVLCSIATEKVCGYDRDSVVFHGYSIYCLVAELTPFKDNGFWCVVASSVDQFRPEARHFVAPGDVLAGVWYLSNDDRRRPGLVNFFDGVV